MFHYETDDKKIVLFDFSLHHLSDKVQTAAPVLISSVSLLKRT